MLRAREQSSKRVDVGGLVLKLATWAALALIGFDLFRRIVEL